MQHMVSETLRRVPASVTREELTSSATTALAAADREYEPEADGDFHRYAAARVRAAVVDTLRSIDWQARGRQPHVPADHGLRDAVGAAVVALPQAWRAVIEGYFLRQLPLAELAADLEIDEPEVELLRADALLALRRTLGPVLAAQRQSEESSGSSGTGSPRSLNLR